MSTSPASLELTEGARSFLQKRVAWAGLVGAGLGGFFLVFRLVTSLAVGNSSELIEPSFALHAAGSLLVLTMWLGCARGQRSIGFIRTVELLGLVGGSVCYSLMGATMDLAGRPDYIVLLALTYSLMARSAYVPSSARRTVALCVAVAVPSLVVAYFDFLDMDVAKWQTLVPEITEENLTSMAFAPVSVIAGWWVCATAICALTSRVIYGLRKEVRDVRKLGQYRLHRKLGEGGMGVVYLASHAMLRRPTAIKLLPLEKAGKQSLARFEREVQLTAGLSHPNTVTIHDYGRTPEGVFYYAMEMLDGATLADVVELSGPLPPGRVISILDQVAGALSEAHGVGLIHRDIKPANIMLVEQGGVPDVAKVLDFGLVKELESSELSATLTHANTLTGTPTYMSPEAIQHPDSVDARSDLYALGAVAYFIITGEAVFAGTNVVEVCGEHLHTPPTPPSKRTEAEVPAHLERLVLDCLAKRADDRPQTALELQARLRALAYYRRWTDADARKWWSCYRGEIDSLLKARAGSVSEGTVEIELLGRTRPAPLARPGG